MKGIGRGLNRYATTVTTPTDTYPQNTTFLLHFENTFNDSSWNALTGAAETGGNLTMTTTSTQKKIGSYSLYSPNAGATTFGAEAYNYGTGTPATSKQILDLTKDWTIEGWVYFNTSLPAADSYFINSDDAGTYSGAQGNGFRVGVRADNTLIWYMDNTNQAASASGAGMPKFVGANAWHHFAVTNTSGVIRTYVDGTAATTTKTVTGLTQNNTKGFVSVGGDYSKQGANIYLDEIRITNGVARYTSSNFTPEQFSPNPLPTDPNRALVTTHLRCENAVLDVSQKQVAWNTNQTMAYNTGGNQLFGSYCMSPRQGASQSSYLYVTTAGDTTVFAPGTGDFTIEGWVYRTATNNGSGTMFDSRPFLSGGTSSPSTGTYQGLALTWDGTTIAHYIQGASVAYGTLAGSATHGMASATWYHVALCRASGVTKILINGVQKASYTDTNNYGFNTATGAYAGTQGVANTYARIGEANNASNNNNGANYDEIRITSGVGRYTGAFTPPTAPFPGE